MVLTYRAQATIIVFNETFLADVSGVGDCEVLESLAGWGRDWMIWWGMEGARMQVGMKEGWWMMRREVTLAMRRVVLLMRFFVGNCMTCVNGYDVAFVPPLFFIEP